MTPQQLLDAAAHLLIQPPTSMRRCWQRGCACLTRIALEQGLRRYWDRVAPSVAGRPMRHQLLALPAFASAEAALTARIAWHGLSRAMHHHTYELAPTVAELQGWHDDVIALLPHLERAGSTGSAADAILPSISAEASSSNAPIRATSAGDSAGPAGAERDQDLTAARTANRELMTQFNTNRPTR
jgi:hypothetical protein